MIWALKPIIPEYQNGPQLKERISTDWVAPKEKEWRKGHTTPLTLQHKSRIIAGGFRICTVSCNKEIKTKMWELAHLISLFAGVRYLLCSSNSVTWLFRCAVLADSWDAHNSATEVQYTVFRVRENSFSIFVTGYRNNYPV